MKYFRRALAAAIAVCILTLCGCSGNQNIIMVEEDAYTEENYPSAEYYAPESAEPAQNDSAAVMPAPANDLYDYTGETESAAVSGNTYEILPSSTSKMLRGDFTYGVVVDPYADIHPLRTVYKDLYSVNHLIFESLVELNDKMQPVPLLADRWTLENNVWTFYLRSGIQFHNGRPFTANDVVNSYLEIRQHPGTHWYELTQIIDSMEAVDDLTLQVSGKSAGYLLLYAMTFPIVESSTIASTCTGLDMPMGTGPYWYIQYDPDSSLRLESNPLWWKRSSGRIESVVVLMYKNIKSALTGVELDEVDALATDYPTAAINKNLSDRMTLDYSTFTYECIVPNTHSAILSDLSVRQALMYAIDRTTLGNTVYAGMAQESEVPVIPGSFLYDAQATRYNYSPERALSILKSAGWNDPDGDGILQKNIDGTDHTLNLRLYTYDRGTTATRSEAVELIAKQLRMVGFNVTVEVGTQTKVKDCLKQGEYDLVLCGFELSELPNLAFLLSSTGSCNYARYNSTEMDTILHDVYYAQSESELTAAMSKMQMKVVEDLPLLGLFFRSGVFISRQSVGGLSAATQYDVLRGLATISPAN